MTTQHDSDYAFTVVDIERVTGHENEIGSSSRLNRAELTGHAHELRSIRCCCFQGFVGRESRSHCQFFMNRKAGHEEWVRCICSDQQASAGIMQRLQNPVARAIAALLRGEVLSRVSSIGIPPFTQHGGCILHVGPLTCVPKVPFSE